MAFRPPQTKTPAREQFVWLVGGNMKQSLVRWVNE